MSRIVISYRRSDSQDITGRIFDRLEQQYGKTTVFRDIDSIHPGIDFRTQIADALKAADALLVVVGPRWLGRGEGTKSRIENEADPVRIEVETALKRDIPIVPLLVGGTKMPETDELPESLRDFAFRHAVVVDGGRDFNRHIEGLIRSLDRLLSGKPIPSADEKPASVSESQRGRWSFRRHGLVGGLAAIVLVLAAILLRGTLNQPTVSAQQPPGQTPQVPSDQFRMTPTFDCVADDHPDERVICNSSELMVLDQTLKALYVGIRNRLSPERQKELIADERAWVEKRHACKVDIVCIRAAYQSRIKILQSWQ